MGLKQIDHGTAEYEQMVQLRHQVLRAPLGLRFSPDELMAEKEEILIAAFDDDEIMGCCMLCPMDVATIRLRQMAVQDQVQRTGIGASIMTFAENIARDKGFTKMTMHARATAVGFYEKFGYRVVGNEFSEVNLPHFMMEKHL